MGTYVDIAICMPPDRFQQLVQLTDREQQGDCVFWTAGSMIVELGVDMARICTLNGAGWTTDELLREAREKLGDAVFDEAGPHRIAVSLEASICEGGAPTFKERLATIQHIRGVDLNTHAHSKIIDVLAGPSGPATPRIDERSSQWLDDLSLQEPTPSASAPEEDLDAIAEQYLQSIDRDAILAAMRAARER